MRWITEQLGIPYTLSVRGSDLHTAPLRSFLETRQIAAALRGAAAVHAVCDQLGRLARQLAQTDLNYSTVFTTVPIPGKLGEYRPDSQPVRFVTCGRLHWTKSLSDLLLAFKCLAEGGANTV